MNKDLRIGNLLIKLIEDLILKKTGKVLLRDDSFFFNPKSRNVDDKLVLNSDMLVFTTDIPPLMNFYQTGKKSVIMNISDLIVKGVEPRGMIISLGLPKELKKEEFIDIINGIIDCSVKFNLRYIGGDINETKELIINPTVFGFKNPSDIIFRNGLHLDDILVVNNKFGLTGVGFDILLNRNGDLESFPDYRRSIMSVLEPNISGNEALILSEKKLATSSIDSSDGLSKSLHDLILSNPNLGFEIAFNDNLIDQEALKYSQEYNIPLVNLVFNGGEEFIHLFTIAERNFSKAKKEIQTRGGKLFRVGKVISGEYIYILEENKRSELKAYGFEHFSKPA